MDIPLLSDREFTLISKLVYDKFGINLTDKKRTLVVERLQKTLRQGEFNSFKAYYEHVISDPSGAALLQLVDKISTNHTYFFRETAHYSYMENELLPSIVQRHKDNPDKKIRIWSAGCSSGEEAYSTAIVLREFFGQQIKQWDIKILATDISTTVLQKAVEGAYTDNSISNLPPFIKLKYFKQGPDKTWLIDPQIKKMVLFKRFNLMNTVFPFKGKFDIIFCRNVMIYFDNLTRDELVKRFYSYVNLNGYLFIGHSESLYRNNEYFKFIKPAIYQKK